MHWLRMRIYHLPFSSRAWSCINGDCVLLQHLLHHGSGMGPVLFASLLYFSSAVGLVWTGVEHGQLYHQLQSHVFQSDAEIIPSQHVLRQHQRQLPGAYGPEIIHHGILGVRVLP